MAPLTPEQQALREGHITASFLPALMDGDDPEIHRKWLELIGDPSWQPKIPTWQMEWGSYGEPFILNWHEKETGHPIIRRGEFVEHPTKPYVGCTLDGFREFDSCTLDAKVTSPWIPVDVHIAHYTPQVIVQRACLQCQRGALVMVHGNSAPTEYQIEADAEYERRLWERVEQFKYCVDNFIEPVTLAFPKIVPPEQWITIDLDQDGANYNWTETMKEQLAIWSATKDSADEFETATKAAKKLLPDECGKLFCAGIVMSRNRANAVSIKRAKA